MSRYIVTTILAVAAAIITVADFAPTLGQPGSGPAAVLLRP